MRNTFLNKLGHIEKKRRKKQLWFDKVWEIKFSPCSKFSERKNRRRKNKTKKTVVV